MNDARIDKAIRKTLAGQGRGDSLTCPDESRIAAYLDLRLRPEENTEFEMHAAKCDACRQVLALSMKLAEDSTPAAGTLPGGGKKVVFHLAIPISALALVVVASVAGVLYYQLVRNASRKPAAVQTAEVQPARSVQPPQSPPALKATGTVTGDEFARNEPPGASKPSSWRSPAAPVRSDIESPPAPIPAEVRGVKQAEAAKSEEPVKIEAEAAKDKLELAADRTATLPVAAPAEPRIQPTALLPAMRVASSEQNANEVGELREKKAAADEAVDRRSPPESARKTGAFVGLAARANSSMPPKDAIRQLVDRADRFEAYRQTKIGDRNFVLNAGYWIDLNSIGHSDATLVEIGKGSKEFEAIQKEIGGIDGLLSPSTAVILFWEGKNCLIWR